MNNLKFKRLSAKNFLCFGPEGIEIDLASYGNIVLVRGENLDINSDNPDDKKASNGTGKSSAISEVIAYTLFGKTIKHPKKIKHDNVINNQTKAELTTEVLVDDLRIVRQRKPEKLRVWESAEGIWDKSTEKSVGGMPATQKWIEDKIGLTFETFVNLVVFTDNSSGSFLECDTPQKRQIIENLLSLDVYAGYSENAKKHSKDAKDKIKDIGKVLEMLLTEYDLSNKRINQVKQQELDWKKNKENELEMIRSRISSKEAEMNNTDVGQALVKYEAAQDRIQKIAPELQKKEADLTLVKEKLLDLSKNLKQIQITTTTAENNLRNLNIDISQENKSVEANKSILLNLEAQKCKNCNFIDVDASKRATDAIEKAKAEITKLQTIKLQEQENFDKSNAELSKLTNLLKLGENKYRELTQGIEALRVEVSGLSKIERPEISLNEKVLNDQINELKSQVISREAEINGPSPFEAILKSTIDETIAKKTICDNKRDELDKANQEYPYYEFWVQAFGDTGIRKFIIDGIIPALNTRVAHWLQFLIDGKIKLEFDNTLEETIERNPSDGDPFVYYAMSGGERRRLNLAVSQANAYIMMLNCGTCPSIVFLDEVTTNIDPVGVQGVYNMIVELSKERQVFVTTHDHDLLDMLSGCETINLRKQGGFTTLVK